MLLIGHTVKTRLICLRDEGVQYNKVRRIFDVMLRCVVVTDGPFASVSPTRYVLNMTFVVGTGMS